MNRHTYAIGIGTVALVSAALLACGGKKAVSPNPAPVQYHELQWVGTDAVYGETPGKRDISIVFVMVDWCGWCSRMKNETLTDSTVIQVLGQWYNCVYLDAESDTLVVCGDSVVTCRQMARDVFGVHGYPTMMFLQRNGEVIGPMPGYKNATEFAALLERMKDGEY